MTTAKDPSAALLLETVPKIMRVIREEMRDLAHGRFTVPQFRILNQLRISSRTNTELATWMGVTAPTMSRMIEALEKKTLIRRERVDTDRRAQTLSLTAAGRREAENIRQSAEDRIAARIQTLSDNDIQALSTGLQLIAQIFSIVSEEKKL